MGKIVDMIAYSQLKETMRAKREADLLKDLKAANICGCGNCRRRALDTKAFYDGEQAADAYRVPENSPFRGRR